LAVNQLLGRTNRVVFTSRAAHTPTAESNEQIYAFFEHFLNRNYSGSAATNAEHPGASAESESLADDGCAKPAEAGAPERRLQPALGKERGQALNSYPESLASHSHAA